MNILILAPHPDDGEFGCEASIKKWSDDGATIHYLAFSSDETANLLFKKSIPLDSFS